MSRSPRSSRDGFTIVEVLLALLLLSFMVMGFQAATGEIIHYSAQSDRMGVAVQLVEDRLNLIQLDTDYTRLGDRYSEPETALPDYPMMTRTTRVERTLSTEPTGILDYTTVTVTIRSPGLREPVARTIVVGAP